MEEDYTPIDGVPEDGPPEEEEGQLTADSHVPTMTLDSSTLHLCRSCGHMHVGTVGFRHWKTNRLLFRMCFGCVNLVYHALGQLLGNMVLDGAVLIMPADITPEAAATLEQALQHALDETVVAEEIINPPVNNELLGVRQAEEIIRKALGL